MHIMESYRAAEIRISELRVDNRILRERNTEDTAKIPTLETKISELEQLIDIMRRGGRYNPRCIT